MSTENDGRVWPLPWKKAAPATGSVTLHHGYDGEPEIVKEPSIWKTEQRPVGIVVDYLGNPIYYSPKTYPNAKFNRKGVISCPMCHGNMIHPHIQTDKHVVRCNPCNIIMYILHLGA